MAHADVAVNGYAVVEVDGAEMITTYQAIADSESTTDYGRDQAALAGRFVATRFRVNAGERELYRDFDGVWKRWDTATITWV
jgi:alkaline phosphatase D